MGIFRTNFKFTGKFKWSNSNASAGPQQVQSLNDWNPPRVQAVPRSIPMPLRWRLYFGSTLAQFVGWAFFGIGSAFLWLMGPHIDFASAVRYHGKLEQRVATVTAVTKTNFTEGGSKTRRGTPVYRYDFKFKTDDGREVTGTSYNKGVNQPAGASVPVEFPAGNPDAPRLVGMRTKPLPIFVSFVLIFPFVGLAFVVWTVRQGAKACDLLAHGELEGGVFESREVTSVQVNRRNVIKYTYRFVARDGKDYAAVVKDHRSERYDDGKVQTLFYDADNPARNVLLSDMNGNITLDDTGAFRSDSALFDYLSPVIPVLVVAENLILAAWVLTH